MKKILFIASMDGHIRAFHIPYIKWLTEQGHSVDVASNGNSTIPYVSTKYHIDFSRSPLNLTNHKAYKQLKKLIDDNDYDLLHCHTPMASVITRLAASKARKKGTKVVYTAHGFHFYKGASIKNWLVYYIIEKILSKKTDCIITINDEDYQFAKKKFNKTDVKFVNGVGIDITQFKKPSEVEKAELRSKHGYSQDAYIIVFAGELSYRKHQDLIIKAMQIIKEDISEAILLLVGSGSKLEEYKSLITALDLEDSVLLLGRRKDVPDMMALADIGVSSSRQEGLPVNVMEGMATGLPIVVTDCRGNRDLIINEVNGFIVGVNDIDGFAKAILRLYNSKELSNRYGNQSLQIVNKYEVSKVLEEYIKIYNEYL